MKPMKPFLLCILFTLLCLNTFALGLKGLKSINSNINAPNNYTSLRLAINDLNTQGVDSGGVIFEFAENHVEYAGNSPFIISATGTEKNPITFKAKNLFRKPTLYAYQGNKQSNDNTIDGIITIHASDYITFDGLILKELTSNTNTYGQMEFGFGFFVKDSIDGAQHNIVKNCEIYLQRIFNPIQKGYTPSGNNGILFINSTYNDVQKSIAAYSDKGTNSYNKIISNKIENCVNGISLIGTAKVNSTHVNQYNRIGGPTSKESNTIEFFGTEFSYTTTNAAIYLEDEYNIMVGNNTIKTNNSSDKEIGNNLYGVYLHQRKKTANYTKILSNLISITTEYASEELAAIFIENGYDVFIENNTIKDLNQYVKKTASLYGIFSKSGNSLKVSKNIIKNISYTVSLNNKAEGILQGIFSYDNKNVEVLNNELTNVIFSSQTRGAFNLINTTNDSVVNISNNKTKNIRTSNENRYYLSLNYINCKSDYAYITNNTFTDDTTNIVYGRYIKIINVNALKNAQISNNIISNIKFKAAQFYGIYTYNVNGNLDLHHNQVNNIYGGLESARPLLIKSKNAIVYNNKLHSIILDGRTYCLISGIEIDSTKTLKLFNNSISNFHIPNSYAPPSTNILPIVGINIFTANTKSKHEVYNNTIYFNTQSTSDYFSTICLNQVDYLYENKDGLKLRNNLFVNTSLPKSSGLTLIINRTTTQFFNNYNSNNNLFYTGPQPYNRAIYKYGKTICYNFNQYKALAVPNDNRSIYGPVEFASTDKINTHLKEGYLSLAESNGELVSKNMFDIDDEPRLKFDDSSIKYGNYIDIGADSFDGLDSKPFGNTRLPMVYFDTIMPAINRCVNQTYTFKLKIIHDYKIVSCRFYYRTNTDSSYHVQDLIKSNDEYLGVLSSKYYYPTFYYYSVIDSIGNELKSPIYTLEGQNSTLEMSTNDSIFNIGDTLIANAYLNNFCKIGEYDSTLNSPFQISQLYSNYSHSSNTLFIIRADELQEANFFPGELNSITFYIKNKKPHLWRNLVDLKISIGQTSENKITKFNTFTFTDVYSSPMYQPKNGANKHTFQNPINWDGVSNLVVKVCYTNLSPHETIPSEEIQMAYSKGIDACMASTTNGPSFDEICTNLDYRNYIVNYKPVIELEGYKKQQTFTWQYDSSLQVLSNTNHTLKALVKNSGAIDLSVQTSNEICDVTKSTFVHAYSNPHVDLGGNRLLCYDDTLVLNARNRNCTYKWYFNNNLRSTEQKYVVYEEGKYKLVVTNINGVTAEDSIYITYAKYLNVIYNTFDICYGKSAKLDAGAGGIAYLWSTGDTTREIEVFMEGLYNVMVISPEGCIQHGYARINEINLPSNYFRLDNLGNKTYRFTSLTDSSSHLYHWDFGDTSTDNDTSNSKTSTYTYANEGAYNVWLKIKDRYTKCENGIQFRLDVKVGIGADKIVMNASVSPNPVNKETSLYFTVLEHNSILNVDLFDLTGRKIKSYATDKLVNSGENSIHLSDIETLDSSVYILRVLVNNEMLNFRLVK